MWNLYRLHKPVAAMVEFLRALELGMTFPDGVPNHEPRDVRISERAPILRPAPGGVLALVQRRWSWPGPTGKPVFNYRAEGRRFPVEDRCVVLADGFYEFTAPADAKARRKDRWLFTWPPANNAGHDWFGIAGIVRPGPGGEEAFALLTAPPGPDVAPYHDRQIVLLSPPDCARWLDPAVPAADLVRPLPAGTLACERAPT